MNGLPSAICECKPGLFHPTCCHDEDGCVVDIHKEGRCPCTKSYLKQKSEIEFVIERRKHKPSKRREMYYGDQRK